MFDSKARLRYLLSAFTVFLAILRGESEFVSGSSLNFRRTSFVEDQRSRSLWALSSLTCVVRGSERETHFSEWCVAIQALVRDRERDIGFFGIFIVRSAGARQSPSDIKGPSAMLTTLALHKE